MVASEGTVDRGNERLGRRKRPPRPKKATLLVEEDEVLDVDARTLVLSADLYDELFKTTKVKDLVNGVHTSGGINHISSRVTDARFVSICPVTEYSTLDSPQWLLYRCDKDPSLPPSTSRINARGTSWRDHSMILIHRVKPISLRQVVLTFTPPAYDYIKSLSVEEMLEYFRDYDVIRKGQYISILDCVVRACEPVDQGILLPGSTKFMLVKDENAESVSVDFHECATGLNIDGSLSASLEGEDMSRFLEAPANWESSNPALSLAPSIANSRDELVSIEVMPLSRRIEGDVLMPLGKESDDSEVRGFVGVDILARIGCFSGDWVMIRTEALSRPLRLYSFPVPNAFDVKKLYISPVLLYNFGMPSTVRIELSSLKEPKSAKEIIISRIPSAASTDRTLQQACLQGLRSYFEYHKRVVAKDDLIAIPIDAALAKLMYTPESSNNFGTSNDDMVTATTLTRPSAIAWCKVTAIVPSDESATDTAFVVDASHTRVVQAGTSSAPHPPTSLPWSEYFRMPPLPLIDSPGSRRIQQLLSVCISPTGTSLQTAIIIHSAKRGVGKATMVRCIAGQLGVHVFEIEAHEISGETDTKTLGTLKARLERASDCSPCIVLIRHLEALSRKPVDGGGGTHNGGKFLAMIREHASGFPGIVIVATVSDIDTLSDEVRAGFNFEIEIGAPSEVERRQMFEFLTDPVSCSLGNIATAPYTEEDPSLPKGFLLSEDIELDSLALQSAGLVPPDLVAIVKSAYANALDRIEETFDGYSIRDILLSGGGYLKLIPSDFERAISSARRKYSDSIGAPRIPSVKWEDVGGLSQVKSEILDTIEMPLKFPELFSGGVKKRSGILFYGPPGTGKTLLAKAIATTFSLNFFSVKGPELLNMYIGESESNVRKVFQRARDARPCIVFFDELDSVAPKRGNQGDSGGVMDRIVSQILAELDGMSSSGGEGVFVIGATNRPDLLDGALLRPGRFDKMLYLGVSDTHEQQYNILTALTRKFNLAPDLDLRAVVENCPFTYTGADFYALCSDAMLNAMTRLASSIDERVKAHDPPVSIRWWFDTQATKEDIEVIVRKEDFDKARKELVASVSEDELRHYKRVRENFEGGKKMGEADALSNSSVAKGKGKAKVVDYNGIDFGG
ncbi:P-loop containing nucleoside triphosphate hydrolase protein [Lipomyces tetrasporus]|uniref:Peroxisomal ATPase PEX6 n=1 Tax=Lipomyces tetrasporus TaxID=54092 RepID=A0AAD7VT68_9ASCO|nr:P-loop containing nucleoside triphosphate hydrolase protein [Lipomyces tetrasporus]KAJ8100419.1 P-loop containing nucleoside triphosphate hydrolase protein [Lipomyces tetrasporus]